MKNYILITVFSLITIACSKNEKESSNTVLLQNDYTINFAGLYPEGIDYDTKNEQFIFGSMNKGAIYAMNTTGEVSTFATNTNLVLITGVYTDEVRNRLIVANADLGISEKSTPNSAGTIATVAVYNLTTKALISQINLKTLTPNAGACPNDIAIDTNGNIFVTDSFSPVIYKIDANYTPTIFANNPLFQAPAGSFGLNGIVFHPDGYFLIAKTDSSQVLKVSLANPSNVSEITPVGFDFPNGMDGMEWNKNNELVIVENGLGLGKTNTFKSSNNWESVSKVSETNIGKEEFPTTAALASNGKVYVISSKLGKLLSSDSSQSVFNIQKIN